MSTQPTVATSVGQLLELLSGSASVDAGALTITDEAAFRDRGIRDVVWSATFSDDADVVEAARWIVWEASQQLDARSASIHELYMARGRGEVHGFTVPAINLRTQVFDMARVICNAAQSLNNGLVIFELARSEQEYTFQRPAEYITSVLAGCIAANWHGPVFIQGDHYQFNAKKYAADPEATTEALRKAVRDALAVGYGNIDIDSSTLVDLSLPSVDEQQHENYRRAAELSAIIRENEASGMTISIGGEIGEVGKENSTEPELRAYLDGYRRELGRLAGRERDRHLQGQRPDGHVTRRRAASGWRRRRGEAGLRHARAAGRSGSQLRACGCGSARRVHAAGRAVPSLPEGRDSRDPSRDRLPEPAL